MTNAPVLSGTAGSLISVLDACLVTGFNLKTVDSIVVAGGVATVNISMGVGAFEIDSIALIAGATPAGLNGEKRLLSVGANTVTFDATGISDQTATGTITVKMAPAGWSKTYSGTNLAVYRGDDVTGTRLYLRVDDTGTTNARVVGYESMSDVNTGTMPFPTAAQQSGGYYWPKANAANGTARGWTVIGDGRTFWVHLHTATTSIGVSGWTGGFGDFSSYKSADAYSCSLNGSTTDVATSTVVQASSIAYLSSGTAYGLATARAYTGLGSAIASQRMAESYFSTTSGYSGSVAFAMYPNGPDNSLILSRMLAVEAGPHIRGVLRGPLAVAQNCAASFNWLDKVPGSAAYAGRKLLAIKGAEPANTAATTALMFFDITGPWG